MLRTILGFETSFDDTAVAVVRDGNFIACNVLASQTDLFQEFGGVVPEIASRAHLQLILPSYRKALAQAQLTLDDIDAIAVTYAPGLAGSLLVGVSFAKGLAYARGLPLYAIHHVEAHLYAPLMAEDKPDFPHICLSAAGGHTALYLIRGIGDYRLLGQSRDDAAGEAFDKVSVALGGECPGGKAIEKLAGNGNDSSLHFPSPMLHSGDYDFSFSGLKTAVVNYLETREEQEINKQHVAAAFQQAAIDVLAKKTISAAEECNASAISLTGGVACNTRLFDRLCEGREERSIRVFRPPPALCTDNAAMVAGLAFHKAKSREPAGLDLNAVASLQLNADKD